MQIAPTTDEIKLLRSYRGTSGELSPPEQFLSVMVDVPRLPSKIGALLFKKQFCALYDDAVGGLSCMQRACQQLMASTRLRRVFGAVLACGNALNAGTHRGNAEALKLESLLKLKDTKATVTTHTTGSSTAGSTAAAAREDKESSDRRAQDNNNDGDNDDNMLQPPPPLRSLLEFVAWKVLLNATEEKEIPPQGKSIDDVARSGYLTDDLNTLGEAVRRMQSGTFIQENHYI